MRNSRQGPRGTAITDLDGDQPVRPVLALLHDGRSLQVHNSKWLTRRRTSYLLIAGVAMSVAGIDRLTGAEGSLSPTQAIQFVRQSGDRLMAVLLGPGDPPEKRRQLYGLISEIVDISGIARFALGRFWTGSSVQHPDRDLLNTSNSSVNEAAARNRTGRPLDHLMNANSSRSPGMPRIGNGHLINGRTTVGLVA